MFFQKIWLFLIAKLTNQYTKVFIVKNVLKKSSDNSRNFWLTNILQITSFL